MVAFEALRLTAALSDIRVVAAYLFAKIWFTLIQACQAMPAQLVAGFHLMEVRVRGTTNPN